ncbi:HNH endonuclease [Cryobacterium luteum]|uniref:HNH endonuclease n=2 Tax=Cryobacterium luteum TaxID=1424661 RepID=A0A5F0DD52_9MICO|nr:HNH endonuclease [Cryobacterium luteum]
MASSLSSGKVESVSLTCESPDNGQVGEMVLTAAAPVPPGCCPVVPRAFSPIAEAEAGVRSWRSIPDFHSPRSVAMFCRAPHSHVAPHVPRERVMCCCYRSRYQKKLLKLCQYIVDILSPLNAIRGRIQGEGGTVAMTLTAPPAATGPVPESSRVEAVVQAGALLAAAFEGVTFGYFDDGEAMAVLVALEGLGRKVDGARLRATTDIGVRAETDLGNGSLAYRNGCRNRVEFITQLAGISGREAKRRLKLGETTVERTPMGLPVPARYPVIADGLSSGELGVEAAEIIATTLTALHGTVMQNELDQVERALVASATGAITPETAGLPGAGIRFAPDLLRAQALEWQGRLDPDGTAPNEEGVEAKSRLTFGLLRNGLYPLRADVTPELRGIMDTLFDTHLSARSRTPIFVPTDSLDSVDGNGVGGGCGVGGGETLLDGLDPADGGTDRFSADPFIGDPRYDGDRRTAGEKRADILRAVFEAAARDPKTPTMGGAAPTVMIHINATDLDNDRGVGWIDGIEAPVSMRRVKETICAGGSQHAIFGPNGDVLYLTDKIRCFTAKQRAAIAARDGGCIIPGCTIPARWTEVHHVVPYGKGGPTRIDNGTLLCWFHHHTIETSGWDIRMIAGRPQVRGPLLWDPTQTWRPAHTHRANTPSPETPWRT